MFKVGPRWPCSLKKKNLLYVKCVHLCVCAHWRVYSYIIQIAQYFISSSVSRLIHRHHIRFLSINISRVSRLLALYFYDRLHITTRAREFQSIIIRKLFIVHFFFYFIIGHRLRRIEYHEIVLILYVLRRVYHCIYACP